MAAQLKQRPQLQKNEAKDAAPRAQMGPSAEEISQLVQETAYFKAEARGFAPGGELQDWLDAESEVRQRRERPAQNERSP